ncbi:MULTISPECIES: alpha/beta hydrolase [unclassified Mesorhizobium]|nr:MULTISPECIES: alpha/beta hydrolase [unclassified Mesorhizobium]TGS84517.1 alpha/beta hydrolase [Mesorhizobium sp. M3A.F.Ca.ET.175.01.1.1]TGT25743.1 alpha/beta hydrolase [Mesorhizobium sp. M3A.F.Ca.ET.174.01.1.1]TGT57371.1 alpha/beta hydrolase [Mesorhizobium sp. M00.F.Ca.ET.170.01.1.1]AZO11898.1 alpha/beta hydrolase [Mesorhizobium sp. M3A.F.Ca.ET.080.04.2.1]PBB86210.1 alpha/beta hydrolase [Mesorhizobium sp. WSM3876]
MPVAERTIRTPEADLRVSDSSGSGLPIVMIHGSGSSRAVFARQFESSLADRHRLIAFDLPGHGDSSDASDPVATYSLGGLAQAAAEVFDRMAIDRAIVFGWSLGGHVAMELASFHPAFAGLMLTGAPPVSKGPFGMLRGFHASWDMLLASKKVYSDRDAERFEALCFGDSAGPSFRRAILRADGRLRSAVTRGMFTGRGADQKQVVEQAQFPVAIVNGENDLFVRLSYFETLACRSLWEHCHVIPGAGHAPFWERPELFNPLLARFAETVATREEGVARSAARELRVG